VDRMVSVVGGQFAIHRKYMCKNCKLGEQKNELLMVFQLAKMHASVELLSGSILSVEFNQNMESSTKNVESKTEK